MVRTLLIVSISLLLSSAAGARSVVEQTSVSAPAPGYFSRAGEGSFACMARANSSRSDDPLAECLRVGNLRIGGLEGEASILIGGPVAQVDGGDGVVQVHALSWAGTPDASELTSYIAVSYDSERRTTSIQLSGSVPPRCCWRFSGLTIGDSTDALIARFGRPFSVEPVPANGATLWLYGSWPFSFEVLDGKISSIRIVASRSAEMISEAVARGPTAEPGGEIRGGRREPSDPVARAAVDSYRACVLRSAERLERSRETADIVADSALESCQQRRAEMLQIAAGSDWRYAEFLGRTVDGRVLAAAQARVVAIRSQR